MPSVTDGPLVGMQKGMCSQTHRQTQRHRFYSGEWLLLDLGDAGNIESSMHVETVIREACTIPEIVIFEYVATSHNNAHARGVGMKIMAWCPMLASDLNASGLKGM